MPENPDLLYWDIFSDQGDAFYWVDAKHADNAKEALTDYLTAHPSNAYGGKRYAVMNRDKERALFIFAVVEPAAFELVQA